MVAPMGALATPYFYAGMLFLGLGLFYRDLGVSDGEGGTWFLILGIAFFMFSFLESMYAMRGSRRKR